MMPVASYILNLYLYDHTNLSLRLIYIVQITTIDQHNIIMPLSASEQIEESLHAFSEHYVEKRP
jgi:hypothetical protein